MNRKELEEHKISLEAEASKRRALGGYSFEADGILKLTNIMLRVVDHLLDQEIDRGPKPKTKGRDQ